MTEKQKLLQVIIDISINAGYLIAKNQIYRIDVHDSAVLMANIVEWAKEFIELYSGEWSKDDYINLIDLFAEKKLLEIYGLEQNVVSF